MIILEILFRDNWSIVLNFPSTQLCKRYSYSWWIR